MTTASDSKRRIEIPAAANATPLRGPPDVRVGGVSMIVTLDLPSYLLSELRWQINRESVVIRSAEAARQLHLIIPLTRPVHAGRFVVVATGTIFDIRLERDDA